MYKIRDREETGMPYRKSQYVRKSDRGKWEPANMLEAIEKVKCRTLSLREASVTFQVPKSTLARRVMEKNKTVSGAMKHLGRHVPTFSDDFEAELVKYVKDMESRYFGITCTELRIIAYQLAERNNLEHQFNKEKKTAGKKWLGNFLNRNRTISLRQPEATSFACATGFNKPAVQKFFILLQEIIEKHNLDGSRLYNIDESGMKTVQQKHAKILALKGKKQIGALTSAERGKNVTVVCGANACGHFIPPFLIFARKKMNPVFMDCAPSSSKGCVQDNGWMTMDLFKTYLQHFVEFVKPTREQPVCLILDGHSSHTRSIDALDYATANGIIMLSLPPHTTHRLQPLDVGFFKPLQTYYDRFIDRWLRHHPGRTFTEYQVAEAFADAFGKAATVGIAQSSFEKCGIWPFNMDIFTEADYAAADTTDRPLVNVVQPSSSILINDSSLESPRASTSSAAVAIGIDSGVPLATNLPGTVAATNVVDDDHARQPLNNPSLQQSPQASTSAAADEKAAGAGVTMVPNLPGFNVVGDDHARPRANTPSDVALQQSPQASTSAAMDLVTYSAGSTPVTDVLEIACPGVIGSVGDSLSCTRVRVTDMWPMPCAPARSGTNKRNRAFQRSCILTSTPHKNSVRIKSSKKKTKPKKLFHDRGGEDNSTSGRAKGKQSARGGVRKNQTPCFDIKQQSQKRKRVVKKATAKQHTKKSRFESAADDNDDTPCCICSKRFNEPPFDSWVQCPTCSQWYHDSCGPGDTDSCYFCLD